MTVQDPNRTAGEDLEEIGLTKEQEKAIAQADKLIPKVHLTAIRRAFTPKGMVFWLLYKKLWQLRNGMPIEEDLVGAYRAAFRRLAQLTSPYDKKPLSPNIVNALAENRVAIFKYLRQVKENPENPRLWTRLNSILVPLMAMVAADKGVYIQAQRMQNTNPIELWKKFRKQSKGQQKLERLKNEDPETYQLMLEKKQTLAEIDGNIQKKILGKGETVETMRLMGRVVRIGVDQSTGEKTVYDRDGDQLPIPDYIEKRKQFFAAQKKLSRKPNAIKVNMGELRVIREEEIEKLTGEVEYVALTDDLAKQSNKTRYFPVKNIPIFVNGPGGTRVVMHKVIVEGRYKGLYLDDMINDQGRLIEGTAYKFSRKRGESYAVPERIDQSDREPYCTVAHTEKVRTVKGKRKKIKTKKLMIKISGDRKNAAIRNIFKKKLCCAGGTKTFTPSAKCVPSMEWHGVEGSKAICVYFEPKDFGLILDTTEGITLSKSANKEIRKYYKELTVAEEATKNTDAYKAKNLNSIARNPETGEVEQFEFIESTERNGEEKPFELLGKQREALAWLDANGGSGVCALDTGIGKTLTAVGGMMKAVRDGWLNEDAAYTRPDGREVQTNGRFLYVCPKSLKGNMPKEIEAFIKGGGGGLVDRVDCLTYQQFARASQNGIIPRDLVSQHKDYWGPLKKEELADRKSKRQRKARKAKTKYWNPENYIQIYFDEAHEMKKRESQPAMAALKLWHPRKICLTASPMEKNPMEAYVLAAISNNTPLVGNGIEARDNRKIMKRFKARFCQNIGGRICGVTKDPAALRDMKTWVKRNVFYADKTQVDEYNLPDPVVETKLAEMEPLVEQCYRAVASQMTSVLEAATYKFREREKQDSYRDKRAEEIFGLRMRPYINLLNTLSNRPADAMRDLTAISKGDIPEQYEYPERYQSKWGQYPRGIKTLGDQLAKILGPGSENLAETIGNPKLDSAEQTILSKIESVEGSRALIFCDDKKLCIDAAIRMSSRIGGLHALCLGDRIDLYQGGMPTESYTIPIERGDIELLFAGRADEVLQEVGSQAVFALPFRKRKYRKYMNLPPKTDLQRAQGLNKNYPPDQWQQFVLKEIIKNNPHIHTCTLLGKEYSHGHNLQTFNTVVHLDRNHWNSESMKQRTARAYRQGQNERVQEVTIDSTYSQEGRNSDDVTLDKIRELFQQMDASIFDGIIKASQDLDLTAEDGSVLKRDASLYDLDKDVLELQLSPYAKRSRPPGGK